MNANPDQARAISLHNGPILCNAGPGTGKTHTSCLRVASMIEAGIDPSSIALLTFTNKAADEMRDRIDRFAGRDGHPVFVGTYHQFAIRKILMPNRDNPVLEARYPKGFVIVDDEDAKSLMREAIARQPTPVAVLCDVLKITSKVVMQEMSLHRARGRDHRQYAREKLRDFSGTNEIWQTALRLADTGNDDSRGSLNALLMKHQSVLRTCVIGMVWGTYTQRCQEVGAMDFDDVLVSCAELLKQDPTVAKRIAGKYQYLCNDEFQDANPIQWAILSEIIKFHPNGPNIFSVGDPKQSIYAFRASDVSILLSMEKTVPGTRVVWLKQNYRSTRSIINVTNALIRHMPGSMSKGELEPQGDVGEKPKIMMFQSDRDEARWIALDVLSQIQNGHDPNEIAVLYRNRSIKSAIEEQLTAARIEYQVVGDQTFWQRKDVRDIVAVYRSCSRPRDNVAVPRVFDCSTAKLTAINLRKKLSEDAGGRSALDIALEMGEKANVTGKSIRPLATQLQSTLSGLIAVGDLNLQLALMYEVSPAEALELFKNEPAATQREVREILLGDTVTQYKELADHIPKIYQEFLLPKLQAELSKKLKPGQDISELLAPTHEAIEIIHRIFTERLDQGLHPMDAVDELTLRVESSSNDIDGMKLMTVHASKGLEFDSVYLAGASDEIFVNEHDEDPDEAIRLFFVAITRPGKALTISHADTRVINGEVKQLRPLRYLGAIEDHCESHNDRLSRLDSSAERLAGGQWGVPSLHSNNGYSQSAETMPAVESTGELEGEAKDALTYNRDNHKTLLII